MTKKPPYHFPKRFLWGASTSAHQVEGHTHNQWTEWEDQNAKSLAHKAAYRLDFMPVWDEIKPSATSPDNYRSGDAADHYHRYEEDFELLNSMNMNAFRFSIEWSRLEPEEGKWDEEALEHYRQYFEALKTRKITPVVTLFHWTLPVWFAEKGGFEKKENIRYFVRFAEKVLEEYGGYLRLICTLNEPGVYVTRGWLDEDGWPPARHGARLGAARVYWNLAEAHKRVYEAAKRKSRRFKLGIADTFTHHYAADERFRTRVLKRSKQYASDEWFMNRIRTHVDWVGINYYFSQRYVDGKMTNQNERVNDLGWEMLPANIEHVIVRQYNRYKKPIIITENGVADMHDQYRKWWIAHTIDGMHRAIRKGAKVDGYLHWSLLDNFEWSYGKWPRFGLVAVNYKTQARTIRQSGLWFGKVIAKLRKG